MLLLLFLEGAGPWAIVEDSPITAQDHDLGFSPHVLTVGVWCYPALDKLNEWHQTQTLIFIYL